MPAYPQRMRQWGALARRPRQLASRARRSLPLWANLLINGWAIAFMLWQGAGFAIAIATVFAIWAILSVSLNLVVGCTGLLSVKVSKVVGINTTVIIAAVFFIGALYAAMAGILTGHDTAAMAGILTGHDTAAQPRMGLILLMKGWIASVVGGIGNLYGAILGGFVLGIVEQFGIWDLAGEWKDAISFILLVLFLSFWPRGLLPRR